MLNNFILLRLKKKDFIFHSTSEVIEKRSTFGGAEKREVETVRGGFVVTLTLVQDAIYNSM